MMYKLLDGKKLSEKILETTRKKVSKMRKKPVLAVILIGDDKASHLYVSIKQKACEKVGIEMKKCVFDKTNTKNLIKLIQTLNNDKKVTGIMVQLPLPKNLDKHKILSLITPEKDVDFLNPESFGKILTSNEGPCTPRAVMNFLEAYKIQIRGKQVCIINHSDLIGKPLSLMFLKKDATVSICHQFTKNLREYTRKADILVSAAGVPGLIKADDVKKGVVVIDAGIKKQGNNIYGDVDFESVKSKCLYITPVPGGVGPMTVAMLVENLVLRGENW